MFSGYNDYAVSNDLIMLFPQSKYSLDNPLGCHDTWGVTGDEFGTKNGVQPKAIMAMVDRLIEPKDPDFKYTKRNMLNWYSR
jgi:poly(3-hydroxybutyrate) depolymerase